MTGAELAARVTAASAVRDDFERATHEWALDTAPAPDWPTWAGRLSMALGAVLDAVGADVTPAEREAIQQQAVADVHAWAADPAAWHDKEPPVAVRLLAEHAMDAGASDWACRMGWDLLEMRKAGATDGELVGAVLRMVWARMNLDLPEGEWLR